ncbi:hypothetical protein I550_0197 [Mycobacterium intracellulare 1956]|uniref:DUF222 domain-containing protein n=1 Tax=Mycobacterium intracellulare 1956 TaxID=1299331 RepID=X8CL15_MYCIT|nr:hypothetical protein I550_0197 [Mycobacterium intracellulare 1956]
MLVARRLAAVAALLRHRVATADGADREYAEIDGFEQTAAEVAAVMNLSAMGASFLVSHAEALDTRLPRVAALLAEGRTDWRTVRLVITRTDLVTDREVIATLDESLAAGSGIGTVGRGSGSSTPSMPRCGSPIPTPPGSVGWPPRRTVTSPSAPRTTGWPRSAVRWPPTPRRPLIAGCPNSPSRCARPIHGRWISAAPTHSRLWPRAAGWAVRVGKPTAPPGPASTLAKVSRPGRGWSST